MPPSLTKINNGDGHTLDEFIRDIENISDQVSDLLKEVREGEIDFAAIKTELKILCNDVKNLSSIIRDGNNGQSLLTRVALLEQQLENIEKENNKLDENKRAQQSSLVNIEVAEKAGKWQLRVAMATGVLGLVASIITTIVQIFHK